MIIGNFFDGGGSNIYSGFLDGVNIVGNYFAMSNYESANIIGFSNCKNLNNPANVNSNFINAHNPISDISVRTFVVVEAAVTNAIINITNNVVIGTKQQSIYIDATRTISNISNNVFYLNDDVKAIIVNEKTNRGLSANNIAYSNQEAEQAYQFPSVNYTAQNNVAFSLT